MHFESLCFDVLASSFPDGAIISSELNFIYRAMRMQKIIFWNN